MTAEPDPEYTTIIPAPDAFSTLMGIGALIGFVIGMFGGISESKPAIYIGVAIIVLTLVIGIVWQLIRFIVFLFMTILLVIQERRNSSNSNSDA